MRPTLLAVYSNADFGLVGILVFGGFYSINEVVAIASIVGV